MKTWAEDIEKNSGEYHDTGDSKKYILPFHLATLKINLQFNSVI